MASDCLYLTAIWIFTLFLSPVTVGLYFGCGKILAINIALYILGVIPGKFTVRGHFLNRSRNKKQIIFRRNSRLCDILLTFQKDGRRLLVL